MWTVLFGQAFFSIYHSYANTFLLPHSFNEEICLVRGGCFFTSIVQSLAEYFSLSEMLYTISDDLDVEANWCCIVFCCDEYAPLLKKSIAVAGDPLKISPL